MAYSSCATKQEAGYWELEKPTADEVTVPILDDEEEEVALYNDNRREVSLTEKTVGSQYYSIAQIRSTFVDSYGRPYVCLGTGSMITEDVMVTAAHCIYRKAGHPGGPEGPARSIDVLFGYENGTWREHRHGELTVTSKQWIDGGRDRSQDIAFVRLSPRSEYDKYGYKLPPLIPFQFGDMPSQGKSWLFIVGHPKDRGNGLYMQEGSGYVEWDIARDNSRLAYQISTNGGQSGAPVLLSDRKTIVAIHSGGSERAQMNYGCPIGAFGAEFEPYMRFFRGNGYSPQGPKWACRMWIQFMHLDKYLNDGCQFREL